VFAPAPNLAEFGGLVGIGMKEAQSTIGRGPAARVAPLGLAFTTRIAVLRSYLLGFGLVLLADAPRISLTGGLR
jgi:hypothetical protein